MIELRDYQESMVNDLREALRCHRRVVLQAATGSGKSVIMADIIDRTLKNGKRVLVTVPKIELIDQMSGHLDNVGVDHGVMQADHWRTDGRKPVQLASVQTLIRRKMPDADLILIDECHRQYQKLNERLKHWNGVPVIGFSATPWSKGLGKLYGALVKPVEINDLIDGGYLVDSIAYGPSAPDMSGVKKTGGDFNIKETAERANETHLIANIHDTWKKLADGKQTLCFGVNIAHSQQIAETFNLMGVQAEHVDAYTDSDERKEAIGRFKAGETKILCSVSCLSEGFDAPMAECAILARPTASMILHYQMIGRVLRPYPGKDKAIILDHAGNFERLGFHTDPTPVALCNGDREEKKKEKKERLPKTCPKCAFLKPVGVHVCPECGFAPQTQNVVHEEPGKLEEISKASMEVKQQWYGMLLGYARKKGFKDGWASHKYKEKYGVWPAKKTGIRATEPNEQVLKWIQHLNIKFAKSQKKPLPTSCKYCGSGNLQQRPGSGPHAASLGCGDCGRHVQWISKENM